MDFGALSFELHDADVMSTVDVLFRWVHVIAAVLWVGLAYFLSWIFLPFSSELTPEAKRPIRLGLLPRVMFFYRFAGLYAFAFGQILLFNLYYMAGDYFYRPLTEFAGTRPSVGTWIQPFLLLFAGVVLYELLVRTLGKLHPILVALGWAAISTGLAAFLILVLETSNRAAFVHVAALFATAMLSNTWSHIWPALNRVIEAEKKGEEPNASDLAIAAERGAHNVYMSMPAFLLMLSVHLSWLIGIEAWYVSIPVVLLVGWVATKVLFVKAEKLDEEQWTI